MIKLLLLFTSLAYAAQAPLPKISIRPLPSPASAINTTILSPQLLDQFKSLVESMGASSSSEANEVKKELNDLYQQVVQKKIYLTFLNTRLNSLIQKMTENPQYKDKKIFSPVFDQEISLEQLGQTFKDLSANIQKTVSLFSITPLKINYLREIIDALPSGSGVSPKINDTRLELIKLLDEVRKKNISLDELVARLYGIKEMFETQPSIKDIEFTSPKFGRVKLQTFSEIIIGDLIEQIGKIEVPKSALSKGIFKELEEPEYLQPKQPAARPLPPTPAAKPTPTLPKEPIQPSAPALSAATRAPHGLSNIGNNCFMNASLQALYTLTDLNNELVSLANKYKPDTFGAEYINLINLMRDPSTGVIVPRAVCHRGWARMGFNPLTQQDNDEFINVLLDDLLGNPLDKNNQPTPLRKLLEIQTQTFLANKPSEPKPGSVLLSLPSNCASLDQCLKNFFAVEKVEYGKPAQPGGPLPIVDKQEKIVTSGKYLIIHLKRNIAKIDPRTQQPIFDNNDQMVMEKLSQPIPFPLTNLDLNPYALPGTQLPLYRLNAIVIHAGSARGGHYTGYVRYGNQWYFVNDSQVSPVSQQQIEQIAKQGFGSAPDQTPTTLFYERM
jgi:ubiquitin C-terminal hydrolase